MTAAATLSPEEMRRQGSISEVRLKDGTVKFRARVRIDGKRVSLGLFDTAEQAERRIAAAVRLTSGRDTHTLRSWGVDYLDMRALDGYHRNERDDRNRWRRVMRAPFADEPLDTLTERMVRSWVHDMIREGCAKTTISNALSLLRVALEEAVNAGHIDENPARPVRVPKIAQTEDAWTWLTLDEVDRLITSRPERYPDAYWHQRTAITVAVYTGLREGELWGLHWGDVELGERPHVTVRYSYRKPTKAGRVRQVPLLPPAIAALKAWKARKPGLPQALVWPSDGGGCHGKGYDAQIKTWVRHAGITRPVRFHDLRHTCASHLVQGSWGRVWSLDEVRQWLGHSDAKMTQRYAHLAPDGLHGRAAQARASWDNGGTMGQRE